MIRTIQVKNVNQALSSGLWLLKQEGIVGSSRNGPVLMAPGPVVTAYKNPMERVLWSELRDCNPFFHLFESMWMLAGRNDTATLRPIVPRMQDFSDDQNTLNGAYGHRWRYHFGYDQLKEIVALLRRDSSTRRAVLSMWDPMGTFDMGDGAHVATPDLTNQGSKDLPCNTHIYFDAGRGHLDMTVCNRSNDVIWGAYGANSVHMSFLHEWMAAAAGLEIGTYYQMSNNYHIYIDRPDVQKLMFVDPKMQRYYWNVNYVDHDNYVTHPENTPRQLLFGEECNSAFHFLDEMDDWCGNGGWLDNPRYTFTRMVLNPMMQAHHRYKQKDMVGAMAVLRQALPSDWRSAGLQWLQLREARSTKGAAV